MRSKNSPHVILSGTVRTVPSEQSCNNPAPHCHPEQRERFAKRIVLAVEGSLSAFLSRTTKSMKPILTLLLTLTPAFAADHTWVLKESTLTYHVSHPLHQTDGVSHAARGKGICHEGQCDFLIAVPVKSFDSGDSNRDLHMIQVTRGAEFPMVTVRTKLPESASAQSTIHADLEIQFAGQTVHYNQVAFELTTKANESHITGTIPATLADFKIEPPTLLTLPVKNELPIRIDMTWTPQ